MKAMRLLARGSRLALTEVSLPPPAGEEVHLRVEACGVCRTDLHLIDDELPDVHYPVTPGHEIVGVVTALGSAVSGIRVGDRLGVPWLASSCGACAYCRSGRENLCERARFTGYSRDGGYAEEVLADARYCLALPAQGAAAELAPLLCAGLIGYRAYLKAGATSSPASRSMPRSSLRRSGRSSPRRSRPCGRADEWCARGST